MKKAYYSKQEIHSNKDFPGCMGGLLNLFDFHHPHNGRKLLTDKRQSDGLEAPRNSLDVTMGTPQTSEIKNEDIPYAYEMKKVPTTRKKAIGMPMKTLIAQEMLKEVESKRHTPSVVARLMGLDSMPAESMSVQHIKAGEIHPQKKMFGKHQQQPKSPRDANFFHKKSKAPSKPPSVNPSPNPYEEALDRCDQKVSAGTHSLQDHPQEQQLQEFKKQFAVWQASKFQDHSKPEDLNIQLSEKQTVIHEQLNEAKMALIREKFIDAKRLATDEKLQQSKEFLDALEVLQSNKELFLKFLQDPKSLFARHPQDIQSTSEAQEKQLPKPRSSSAGKRNMFKEKDHSKGKTSKEENKNERRLQRQKGHKYSVEEVPEERDLFPDTSMPVCTIHEHNKHYPSVCSDGKNNFSSLPTRIVVLKPGPGKPQNYRPSPSPSSSPHSQTSLRDSGERQRGTTQEFLREVRERLKLSFVEKKKGDSKTTEGGLYDQPCIGPKDPRHIAQQIARQVRESVTRDLATDSSRMGNASTFSGFYGKKSLSSRSMNASIDMDIDSCTEISKTGTNYSWDYRSMSNPPVSSSLNKPSDVRKHENLEPRKTVSGRFRTSKWEEEEQKLRRQQLRQISNTLETTSGRGRATQWEEEEQLLRRQQLRQISNTLGEMLAYPGNKKHVSQSKSYLQNNRGNASDDGTDVLCCDMHESGGRIKRSSREEMDAEREGFLGSDIIDGYGDALPRSLSRSWSLPQPATTFERLNDEKEDKTSCVHTSKEDEIGPDSQGGSLPSECIKSKNEKSSFKDKVSNLKDSFLLKGRRSNSKKSHSVHTMQPNNYVEIHFDDECDLLHEEPSSLNRLEKSEDLPATSLQANCKPDVDCPGVATEQLASSSCSLHGTSVGDEDSEECLNEASNLVSTSAKEEDKLSDADSDRVIEEVAPEDHQQILPSSSPTKGLNVNESSASGNLEKGEQPSPISVLDIPFEEDTFQEETPSFKRFAEISSNLQELRTRLHLLKSDGSENLQHNSENVLTGEATVLEGHDMEEIGIDSEKTCDSPSEAAISPASRSSCPEIEIMDVGSVMLNTVLCPQEKWADLQYVRNSLVASGFTGNADAIFAKWHSPNHPMDPHLYEKLQDNDLSTTDSVSERERIESQQHLLFDCTNEVLLEILGPFFYPCPWVKSSKGKLQHVMPVGNQLLEETWRKLSNLYPQSGMDYTLENIVARDINREGTWLELQDDVEMVGVELERLVFDDLIEEICCDLINI